MPELPEVETTRRGLKPLILGRTIRGAEVREPRLRWPVQPGLSGRLAGREVIGLGRRAKYLLIETTAGTLLVHLGMSGSLRYLERAARPGPHDHVDLLLDDGGCLRLNDPRRFGSLHFTRAPQRHRLLRDLGPEPLGEQFHAHYLWGVSRGRRVAIQQHLMNSRIVAGLGNIYATEVLHRAGIHPLRPAGRIARPRIERLVGAVQAVLQDAVRQGGTTLRDFVGGDGRPGYFQRSLEVYGREHAPCGRCGEPVRRRKLGGRSTFYCARCQR